MSLDPAAQFRQNPNVIATDLESELILLDPASQEMYSLNWTGRLVWGALPAGSIDEILERVRGQIRADEAMVRADISALLDDLVDSQLVIRAGAD